MAGYSAINQREKGVTARIVNLPFGMIFLITLLAVIGFAALYSAAGGDMDPWASRQVMRFIPGFIIMIVLALVPVRLWYEAAYPIYALGIILLAFVEIAGSQGMGAQRWIDFGFIQIQPSEFMKIAVVLALARYFHGRHGKALSQITAFLVPVALIICPVLLVLLQPDLGTSLMIVAAGAAMFFIAGLSWWFFAAGGVLAALAGPLAWVGMHDYQKERVRTFLDPDRDPLGAGYHIIQSKIALGSGGVEGKGFLQGTQARLDFLPEKHTDFIFTLWAEEWGLFGGLLILVVIGLILLYGFLIADQCRMRFTRYLAMGLSINFFLYAMINISMVMGLIPVVGAPLPLVSYGGTSMLAALCGFGLIMNAAVYRDKRKIRE